YYIRFYSNLIPVTKGIPPFNIYLQILIYIIVIWGIVFKAFALYQPMRINNPINEAIKVVEASIFSVLILIAITYGLYEHKFSRILMGLFFVSSTFLTIFARATLRKALHEIRKRGYNLRYAIIVGAGEIGQKISSAILSHPELGIKIVGFLTRHPEKIGTKINGIPVIGLYKDIQKIIRERKIDQVYVALPLEAWERMKIILSSLEEEIVDIKLVPDFYQYVTLHGGVEELDGLPIINLQESPFYGWRRMIKRGMDIVISLFAIIFLSPLFLVIALAVKLTSPGPILFKQKRMGFDGVIFEIYKFRSMYVDAEKETGPVWAKKDDPRRTPLGAFLRRTSLDELPQFFNVLKGDMSLIGPRPERPEFIEKFKKEIPRYMLRHKIKAGMSGWAQVNGFRGNSSITKRIEHDLYYIENWSLTFDLKILWLTLWKGIFNKNAY
ncbi:MAG: undecaprenyl-phosphate glucose phosphotransferase, partial [Spirochaetes bacterium]